MKEEKKHPDDMLSATDAGKILGVSGKTVLRMREDGELPGYKIRDLWKFKRGEIEAYRDAQRYPSSTESGTNLRGGPQNGTEAA